MGLDAEQIATALGIAQQRNIGSGSIDVLQKDRQRHQHALRCPGEADCQRLPGTFPTRAIQHQIFRDAVASIGLRLELATLGLQPQQTIDPITVQRVRIRHADHARRIIVHAMRHCVGRRLQPAGGQRCQPVLQRDVDAIDLIDCPARPCQPLIEPSLGVHRRASAPKCPR